MIQLRGMDPGIRPYAEYAHRVADHFGLRPEVTSVYRSWAQQAELRRRYERGGTRFPANRPGDSAHQYGLAWDSWVPEGQVEDWKAIRRWVGFHVPDHDWIHGELPGWRNYV